MIIKEKIIYITLLCILFSLPSFHNVRAENQSKYTTSLWAGYYQPHDSLFEKVYSDNERCVVFFEFSRKIFKFEASLGVGGTYFRGYAVDEEDQPTLDKAELGVVPSYLQLCYPLQYKINQRVVPYLGAGFDAWAYREKTEGEKVEGVKYGYHGLLGLRLLLDWLDPKAANWIQKEGIENTYLVFEARHNRINNFGENKLDLTGPIYKVGILIEY